MHTLSVSALNEQIKSLLENSFSRVYVEGELSRITFHSSGHIYFTLKDASSTLSCVMFRGNASKLKFQLKEGLKVVIDGALTLYTPRGSYQINCFSIEPAGHGALALAYEQLKEKLSAKGYFNQDIKKELKKFPSKIALITSSTGAALQDMLKVVNSRYKNIEIDIYDVLVQGNGAAYGISDAIIYSDKQNYDILVVSRGGGSIEDLWAFNEEIVADAIYNAKTPVVSAVGHEIDWVISDFVADLRAPTPTAAMSMILPDMNELYQYIDSLSTQMTQVISQKLFNKRQELEHLFRSYSQHSLQKRVTLQLEEVDYLKENFSQSITFKLEEFSKRVEYIEERLPHRLEQIIGSYQNQLLNLKKALELNNPKFKTKKGFAQLSYNSKVIDIKSLKVAQEFEIQSDSVVVSAKVINTKKIEG